MCPPGGLVLAMAAKTVVKSGPAPGITRFTAYASANTLKEFRKARIDRAIRASEAFDQALRLWLRHGQPRARAQAEP